MKKLVKSQLNILEDGKGPLASQISPTRPSLGQRTDLKWSSSLQADSANSRNVDPRPHLHCA